MRLGEAARPGFPVAQFPCLRVRIFVAVLNANREVSRGLRSPVLESTLGSRTGLFSLKHKDGGTAPAADSSCQLSESEMTKSDAVDLQWRYGEVMSREESRLHHRRGDWIMDVQAISQDFAFFFPTQISNRILEMAGAFIEGWIFISECSVVFTSSMAKTMEAFYRKSPLQESCNLERGVFVYMDF